MNVIYTASSDHIQKRFRHVPEPSSVHLTGSIEQQYFHFLESLENIEDFLIASDGGIEGAFQDAFVLASTLTPVVIILKLIFYK